MHIFVVYLLIQRSGKCVQLIRCAYDIRIILCTAAGLEYTGIDIAAHPDAAGRYCFSINQLPLTKF